MRESALIELAASAMHLSLATANPHGSNQRDEQECRRLTEELGLDPLGDARSIDDVEHRWRKQLRTFRHKDILRMGMLLARQHTFMSYVQTFPRAKERLKMCLALDQIEGVLQAQFDKYGLQDAFMMMPHIPWPNAPDSRKEWSGDALRECVIRELDTLNATAPSDTP